MKKFIFFTLLFSVLAIQANAADDYGVVGYSPRYKVVEHAGCSYQPGMYGEVKYFCYQRARYYGGNTVYAPGGYHPHGYRGPTKAQKYLGAGMVAAGAAIEMIEILR